MNVVTAESFVVPLESTVRNSFPYPLSLIITHPSNPSCHMAPLDFYKDVIEFAKKLGFNLPAELASS